MGNKLVTKEIRTKIKERKKSHFVILVHYFLIFRIAGENRNRETFCLLLDFLLFRLGIVWLIEKHRGATALHLVCYLSSVVDLNLI